MKRLVRCGSILAALAVVATTGQAQRTAIVGVGANIPTSDYKDAEGAKTGFQLMGGIEFPFLSSATALRFDGMIGKSKRETQFDESNYLASINARLVYFLPLGLSSARPYILGGIGYLYNKYNPGQSINVGTSKSEVVYGGGAGLEVTIAGVSPFVEARYDYGADKTRLIAAIVGLRFKSGS